MCQHRQPPKYYLKSNAAPHGAATPLADASGQKVMDIPEIGRVAYKETDFFGKVAHDLREVEYGDTAEDLPEMTPDERGT